MSIRDSLKNTFNRENIVAKTNDMKAGAQIGASKDMLRVARDSNEPVGTALNAQKDDKGVPHAGNYRYKTDALVLMLDGLMAKLNPNAGRAGDKAIKQRSTALLTDMRNAGLNSGDFRAGIKKEIHNIMERERTLAIAPKSQKSAKAAAFDNKEFKILEEVLTTLGTRMSPQNDDKFGLNKKKPNDASGSDRSYPAQQSSQQTARNSDEQALDAGRDKRAYHKQVGNAVKNLGGALKGTVRSTGAALRTYTEAPRRQAAIGGLVAAEVTAEAGKKVAEASKEAGKKVAEASKEAVKTLDVAQAHALGRVEAAAQYVTTAVGKTGKDLGKATARVGRDLAQGVKDAHVKGAEKFGSKVEKRVEAAKARAGRGKSQNTPPQSAPAQRAPSIQASERPSLSRSSSTASLSDTSSIRSNTSGASSIRPDTSDASSIRSTTSNASSTASFRSAKSSVSTAEIERRTPPAATPRGPNRPARR